MNYVIHNNRSKTTLNSQNGTVFSLKKLSQNPHRGKFLQTLPI